MIDKRWCSIDILDREKLTKISIKFALAMIIKRLKKTLLKNIARAENIHVYLMRARAEIILQKVRFLV